MKLNRLKYIDILFLKVRVIWDKSSYGGSFDLDDNIITIGTKSEKDLEIFVIVQHEILEVLMAILNLRYTDYGQGGNYKFFMDHKEFENLIQIYTPIINKFIKAG